MRCTQILNWVGYKRTMSPCSLQPLLFHEQRALASASIVLSPKGMMVARHVAHLPSSIFSPADNGTLWQSQVLHGYAKWERSSLEGGPVPPAEKKGGRAAGG